MLQKNVNIFCHYKNLGFLESITITLEVQGLFMLSHSQLIANLVMFNLLRYCHVENEVMWFDPYSFMHDIITIMNECCFDDGRWFSFPLHSVMNPITKSIKTNLRLMLLVMMNHLLKYYSFVFPKAMKLYANELIVLHLANAHKVCHKNTIIPPHWLWSFT
jgi:hypothetical protein